MQSSPLPRDLLLLRPRYLPQDPILEHPQPNYCIMTTLTIRYQKQEILSVLMP
jgi:hypothetical protein